MSKPPRSTPQANADPQADPDGDAADNGGASFAWEFRNEDRVGQSTTALPYDADAPPLRAQTSRLARESTRLGRASDSSLPRSSTPKGNTSRAVIDGEQFGPTRANYVRDQLERSLDRWWAMGELPPLMLLREALLLLEAGGTVSESHRTLLLRTAIAYNRGVATALRHQADAERIALVLAEAVVEWEVPLDPERLPQILHEDARAQQALVAELERSRVLLTGEPRRRAQHALDLLLRTMSNVVAAPPKRTFAAQPTTPPRSRRPIRQLILLLLFITLVGFVLWQQRQAAPANMIAMPAASYALLTTEGDGDAQGVPLEAFFIDRFEATNRAYRMCIERGACVWPLATHSATRVDYFTNPAFDDYPVVHVTQAMAATFCAWQGKRLPTVAEWQAAASVSLITGQPFRYPWGATFEAQRANSASTKLGDTVVVGAFRPGGDSPSGASDMAGNVAEWTATVLDSSEIDSGGVDSNSVDASNARRLAIVKGGWFESGDEELFVGAQVEMAVDDATAYVGFRCARTHLLTQS